jgi:hypothetical protein
MDVWIAAVAEVHDLTLVTRNVAEFAPLISNSKFPVLCIFSGEVSLSMLGCIRA